MIKNLKINFIYKRHPEDLDWYNIMNHILQLVNTIESEIEREDFLYEVKKVLCEFNDNTGEKIGYLLEELDRIKYHTVKSYRERFDYIPKFEWQYRLCNHEH